MGDYRTPKINFKKGKYKLLIEAKGPLVNNEASLLKIKIGNEEISQFFTPIEYNEKKIEFEVKNSIIAPVHIIFTKNIFERGAEDRNIRKVWIKYLRIEYSNNRLK
jgi:hypothetical protein